MSPDTAAGRSPFWWFRWVPAALLVLLALYLLVVLGHSVFIPLLVSFALVFMLEPLVTRFEGFGLGRPLAVVAALTAATLVTVLFFLLLVPSVWHQIRESLEKLPAAIQAATSLLHDLAVFVESRFGSQPVESFKEWLSGIRDDPSAITSRVGTWLYSGLFGLANAGSTILGLLIVPFFVYYLLLDLNRIRAWIEERIPERFRGTGSKLFDEIGVVVRGYVRGRLLVALAMSAVYAVGLFILGVPLWAGIGIIAGFLGIVPYLGVLSGFILAVAFAALDGSGLGTMAAVGGLFVLAQFIEDYLLTPRLIGDRLELHPMLVFIGLMIAGDLFGLVGLVLAIPVLAVCKVVFKFVDELYRRSDFFAGAVPEAEATAERVRGAVAATTGALPKLPAVQESTGRKSLKKRITERLGSR
jgi:predicted PurR-regulated permease PerM